MSPYRKQADKPKEKGVSFMEKLKKVGEFVIEGILFCMPVIMILGLVGIVIGLFYLLHKDDEARRMHQEHDTYVLNQQICDVHNGWYTPSENVPSLTACRRLTDHSLFFVQVTGREMIPSLEYTNHEETNLEH
jgi:hypothetical protein